MGSKQSNPTNKQQKPFAVISHPLFKQAKLLNDKQGEHIQISVPVVNQNEILNWQKKFKLLISHQSLFLPLSYEFKRTELCGSNGVCKIKYDNYPFLLKDQIYNRGRQTTKPFENEQLWYLAFNLLEAASIFHQKGQKVGDIQPSNIFINDNGQTKVANQYSWPHQLINYQKTVYEKQITYLAPQQIKDLHFGLTQSKSNLQLAQSFTIGLTLLDSTLLTDSSDLYSLANFRINYQLLDERRNAIKRCSNIDDILKQVIIGLTAVDPLERLKATNIFNWMNQYRESIVNMEQFDIKQLPNWIKIPNLQKVNSQVLRSSQPMPFYGEPNRQIIYQEAVRNQNSPLPLNGTIIGIKQPVINRQISKPTFPVGQIRQPLIPQTLMANNQDTSIYLQDGPIFPQSIVHQSNYIEMPTYAPSINAKSDDFRETLQRIDQQLAISRKMFPN